MISGRARTAFGVLAGLALAVSAGATGMAASAAGAPAPSAATAGSPPVGVAPTPCSPRGDGACTVAPAALAFAGTLPPNTAGVNLTWTTPARPPGTPGPAQTSAFLKVADGGGGCHPIVPAKCSWPWPSVLEAPGSTVVLNGSYAACSSPSPIACNAPSNVKTAAPPAPPAGARASGGGGSVAVTWNAGPEPDLAGYTVTRNNVAVFTCNVHGAPLPGSVPCGAQLAYTDRLATGGAVTYGIVAKRFGLDSNPANYLTSTPSVAAINLGSGRFGGLPPIPAVGIPSVPLPVAPPSTAAAGGAGAVAGAVPGATSTVDPAAGGLEYGPQDHSAALGPLGGTRTAQVTDVSGLALIAAGVLILALAAHLLYLRGAVGRYQREHGGSAARGAHRRQRPPVRVQWGNWPPLIRDGGDLSAPG